MRWRGAAIVVAVAAAAVLAGCAPVDGVALTTSDDGNVLLSHLRDTGGGMDAVVEGTLATAGTCFGLTTDQGTFAVVFPPGSSIIEGTEQIAIPHWGTLSVGDHLKGSGGYFTSDKLGYADQLPETCRTREVAVLNPFE